MDNYNTYIDTFIFRRSWGDIFKDLTDAQAGRLIKSIYLFTEGEDAIPDEPELKTLYKVIRNQLNDSSRRYVIRNGLKCSKKNGTEREESTP